MKTYEVTVTGSLKDMTARERISVKSFDRAIALDEATADGKEVRITVDNFVELHVHNEKAKEGNSQDYDCYVIISTDGKRYRSGSLSLYNAFMDIYEELKDEAPDEPIEIVIYKQESKNYKGKGFLSCALAE